MPKQSGQAIGLSVNNTIAGRTDTSGSGERKPSDPTGLGADDYTCKQTDFDVALPYENWMHGLVSQISMLVGIVQLLAIALDRIMIGFNGTSAAATTDRVANPKLQDVNIGWLEKSVQKLQIVE